jgi:hypothetical protein
MASYFTYETTGLGRPQLGEHVSPNAEVIVDLVPISQLVPKPVTSMPGIRGIISPPPSVLWNDQP